MAYAIARILGCLPPDVIHPPISTPQLHRNKSEECGIYSHQNSLLQKDPAMSIFSTAAIDSACETISQRVVSTSSELDGLIKSGDPASHGVQRLLALSAKLGSFRQAVEILRESILAATVVSPVVQSGLGASVHPCSDASAIIEKEIIRLQPGFTVDTIETDAVLEYEDHQGANAHLFALFAQILQM